MVAETAQAPVPSLPYVQGVMQQVPGGASPAPTEQQQQGLLNPDSEQSHSMVGGLPPRVPASVTSAIGSITRRRAPGVTDAEVHVVTLEPLPPNSHVQDPTALGRPNLAAQDAAMATAAAHHGHDVESQKKRSKGILRRRRPAAEIGDFEQYLGPKWTLGVMEQIQLHEAELQAPKNLGPGATSTAAHAAEVQEDWASNACSPILTPVRRVTRRFFTINGMIRNELFRKLMGELLGTLMFQVFGGAAPTSNELAAQGNGFALVAVVYAFANVSGAHLNPAVSLCAVITGHMRLARGVLYILFQVMGATLGCLLYAALIPALKVGGDRFNQGCFAPSLDRAEPMLEQHVWGWEATMTFLLVITVYGTAIARPGMGNTAPLAIGLSLYACAISGGRFTGASVNPARILGPAIVFKCWNKWTIPYVAGEFTGGIFAALAGIMLFGGAPERAKRFRTKLRDTPCIAS